MIRKLSNQNFSAILSVVNEAAVAYKEVIPSDRWKEPYMSVEDFSVEIESGVEFYGYFENECLIGVMGIQPVKDVTLIRHAYVLTSHQRRGIGGKLLTFLKSLVLTPKVFVGTWSDSWWAIRFYEKNGFRLVSQLEKNEFLHKYWNIPERQVETSAVLELKRQT